MKYPEVLQRPRRAGLRVSPAGDNALFRQADPTDGVLASRIILRDLRQGNEQRLDAGAATFAPDGRVLIHDGFAFRYLDRPDESVLEWRGAVARIEAHESGFVFEAPQPAGAPVAAYTTEFVRYMDRRVETGPQLWSFRAGALNPLLDEGDRWRVHASSWGVDQHGQIVAILRGAKRPTRLSQPAILSEGREPQQIGESGFWYEQVRPASDGHGWLAIRRVVTETGAFHAPVPVRLGLGATDRVLDSYGYWPEGVVAGPDGSYVLLAHSNGYDQALHVTASGATELFPARSATEAQFAGGRWWALASNFFTEPDIASSPRAGENDGPRSAVEQPVIVERRTLPTSSDDLDMWILTPPGTNAPTPVIVYLTAYTPSAWANRWFFRWNPTAWVEEGYAVLMVNVHPTTSGGARTVERFWGDWDLAARQDIDALWRLIDDDQRLDASRVFTLGGGWGGWLAGYLATHDARFAGHAIHSGAWDLVSYLATNDQGDRWEDQLGDPTRNRSRLDRQSPWSGDVVPARVIIFAGDADFRSPVEQSIHALHDLLRAGSDATLVDIAGESHIFGALPTELAWYGMLAQWFRGEPVSRPPHSDG